MKNPLLTELVHASAQLQHAHLAARAAGREDICQLLREGAWKIAAAISVVALDHNETESQEGNQP